MRGRSTCMALTLEKVLVTEQNVQKANKTAGLLFRFFIGRCKILYVVLCHPINQRNGHRLYKPRHRRRRLSIQCFECLKRLCVCVCARKCAYICTRARVCLCMCVRARTCVCMCVCTCLCVSVYWCVCVCVCVHHYWQF